MLGYTPPPRQTSPQADTPQADIPPSSPPQADTFRRRHPRSHPAGSRPPGADTTPTEHAGRYGQRAGGTHPTGMQSCDEFYRKVVNCSGKDLATRDNLYNIH